MIPQEAVDEIKRRTNLATVIGRHTALTPRGRSHIGLCPFHSEKTPSFSVRADEGFYKCFGCGAAGDVFTFLRDARGLPFVEAARELARDAGVQIDETEDDTADIQRALDAAQAAYRAGLCGPKGYRARRYLTERGITPEVARLWGIGYDDGHEIDESTGCHGLMRGRVTLPIRSRVGRVVSFAGRALDGGTKYVNGRSSALYDKSRVLYGLDLAAPLARAAGHVVLCEGYFDVIALHRAGVPAVAPCGTAVTDAHARMLGHYGRVVLWMDDDEAGRVASRKAALALMHAGVLVDQVADPPGQTLIMLEAA